MATSITDPKLLSQDLGFGVGGSVSPTGIVSSQLTTKPVTAPAPTPAPAPAPSQSFGIGSPAPPPGGSDYWSSFKPTTFKLPNGSIRTAGDPNTAAYIRSNMGGVEVDSSMQPKYSTPAPPASVGQANNLGFGVGAAPGVPPTPGGIVGGNMSQPASGPATGDTWKPGAAYDASKIPADFNWQSYVAMHPDLGRAGIDTEEEARRHYVNDGIAEGRNYWMTSPPNNGGFQQWNVTPKQTVQQQTADIARQDSPLMQQARGRAMQQMNERGLINSSLAVQAAQDAVLDRAIQIGGADAATNANAAQFNANQGNAWNLAQQDMEYKRWALGQNFENEKQLRELENKYRDQLATDDGFQKQYNMYLDGIFQIDMNKDLDPETKRRLKQEQGQRLDDYVVLKKLNIDMDFSDYWQATAAPETAPAPAPTTPAISPTPGGFESP